MNTDCIRLTQELVRIPSYVKMFDENGKLLASENQVNEIECAKYIEKYLIKNTKLKVTKQPVKDGRYNLLAGNIMNPKLIVFAHIDTVAPSNSTTTPPFSDKIKGGKLYGLGSTDMKAGVASLLVAASNIGNCENILLIFYVDEEYDFAGMKSFVNKYNYLRPELILSADFEGLLNGCRGLIEICGTILGKSSHACRPEEGRSSINGTIEIIKEVKILLEDRFKGSVDTSFNLGYLEAGKGESDLLLNEYKIIKQINSVPDTANFSLDVRPGNTEITATKICELLKMMAKKKGCILKNPKIIHDYGAWITPRENLKSSIKIVRKKKGSAKLLSISKSGYIDMQIAWERFGRPAAVCYGPGARGMSHKPNEYVHINSIKKATDIYYEILRKFQ